MAVISTRSLAFDIMAKLVRIMTLLIIPFGAVKKRLTEQFCVAHYNCAKLVWRNNGEISNIISSYTHLIHQIRTLY